MRGYLRMWRYNVPLLIFAIVVVVMIVTTVFASHPGYNPFDAQLPAP